MCQRERERETEIVQESKREIEREKPIFEETEKKRERAREKDGTREEETDRQILQERERQRQRCINIIEYATGGEDCKKQGDEDGGGLYLA